MRDIEPMDFSGYDPIGGPETGPETGFEGEAAAGQPAVSVTLADPLAGSRTYRLLSPLKIDGKTVRVIRMRHLRQEEIDGFSQRPYREMIALACDLPAAAISALIWPDSEAVHALFDDMLPLGRGD